MRIALSVSQKEKAKGQSSAYVKALVAAGAAPDEVTMVTAADRNRLRTADVDGVLFAGGEDVDPELYGEELHYENVRVNRPRDDFERAFLDKAIDLRLPILGICRGSQLINVTFGGTLYQDLAMDTAAELEHQQPGSRRNATHCVTVTDPDSHAAGVLPASCRVNSLHHQAIKRLGRGLKVTARAEDGHVEAIEAAEDYPFLMAVQWHPEEMAERDDQRRIFERFVACCRERAAARRSQAQRQAASDG